MSDEQTLWRMRLDTIANGLERIVERLAADARPGHVEYLSKHDAARCVAAYVLDLRQIASDIDRGE